jgi:putative GTP pyrophosphokinase
VEAYYAWLALECLPIAWRLPMSKSSESKPPWGSKGLVNRAGDAIRNNRPLNGAELEAEFEALEIWRASHSYVLNTFQAVLRGRTRGTQVVVAQRLKRRWTIVDKLYREPKMQLSRMDDIAGCRMIFPSMNTLLKMRASIHNAHFKHQMKNEVDR